MIRRGGNALGSGGCANFGTIGNPTRSKHSAMRLEQMTCVGSPPPNRHALRPDPAGTSEARNQGDRKKVAREVNHIFDVVNVTDVAQRLIEDLAQVAAREIVRTAYADVVVAILTQRRQYHSRLDQRLHHQEIGLFAILLDE